MYAVSGGMKATLKMDGSNGSHRPVVIAALSNVCNLSSKFWPVALGPKIARESGKTSCSKRASANITNRARASV